MKAAEVTEVEAGPSAFELQRAERIRQNEDRLAELGVKAAAQRLSVRAKEATEQKAEARRSKKQQRQQDQEAEPPRRSKRQQQAPPEQSFER